MSAYTDTDTFRNECPREAYRYALKTRAVSMDTPAPERDRAASEWCARNGNPMHIPMDENLDRAKRAGLGVAR